MGWLLLTAAILMEVAGTTSMKLSEGLTRAGPTVAIFVCYGISFVFLTLALKSIPLGTAYAIWSGVGTIAIALIGFVVFKEAATALKLSGIALVIAGVVMLKLSE